MSDAPSAALLPHLTQARAPLTREIRVVDEFGDSDTVSIPVERPLTVYVDKRELVTLMTLGAQPELLVLGFLRNQRLVRSVADIESITVDWAVGEGELGQPGVAAVRTRRGIAQIEQRTARRVVTTGCGQGSVFGDLMAEIDRVALPPATLSQAQLYGIVNAIRLQESTYKSAGSVHGCALFRGEQMLTFVEDVGRHNAIDTIAGWMWMNDAPTLGTDVSSLPPEGALAPWGDAAQRGARSCTAQQRQGRPSPGSLRRPTASGGPAALDVGGMRGDDKVFYTTGRLTSEMVIKSAQMGVPIVVSRSGITQMGYEVAERVGLCAIGRATHRHFLCYTAPERLLLQSELAPARPRPA